MAETYFDTNLGELLVGEAAIAERVEQAGYDSLINLASYVSDNNVLEIPQKYGKVDGSSWDRQEYIAAGQWILKLMEDVGSEEPLTVRRMRKVANLGLVPEPWYVRPPRFRTFSDYKLEIGSPLGYDRVQYKDMRFKELVGYAEEIVNRLGYLPTIPEIDDLFRQNFGPSFSTIEERCGGKKKLFDKLGFPDTHEWEPRDFVIWGVKVLGANPGQTLSLEMIKILSAHRRGPSTWTITSKYGPWKRFKNAVEEEFADTGPVESATDVRKLTTYRDLLAKNELLREFANLQDDRLVQVAARYQLIDACAPRMDPSKKVNIALRTSLDVVQCLQSFKQTLSAAEIETTAVICDIFDEVWPPEAAPSYLSVDPQEVERLRVSKSEKKQAYRARQRTPAKNSKTA